MMQISKDNDVENLEKKGQKVEDQQTPRTRVCLYQAGKIQKIKPIGHHHYRHHSKNHTDIN